MSTSAPIHPRRHGRAEPGAVLRWVMAAALLGVSALVVLTGIRTARLGDLAPIRPVHVVAPIRSTVPLPTPVTATPSHAAGASSPGVHGAPAPSLHADD
jgi:hypothetical protein